MKSGCTVSNQTLGIIAALLCIIALFAVLGSRPSPPPTKKVIGGCKGTQYGCCPDGKTACDRTCTNCYYS